MNARVEIQYGKLVVDRIVCNWLDETTTATGKKHVERRINKSLITHIKKHKMWYLLLFSSSIFLCKLSLILIWTKEMVRQETIYKFNAENRWAADKHIHKRQTTWKKKQAKMMMMMKKICQTSPAVFGRDCSSRMSCATVKRIASPKRFKSR